MKRTVEAPPIPTAPSLEQILMASSTDYMSNQQLTFFRTRLCMERDALLAAARETTMHLQDNTVNADPSDRASQEEDYTLELRVRDRERKHLQRINQALERIDNGTYGWCEETGEPIGIGRLLARPTTIYCIDAQERHETLQKRRRG